MPWTYSISDGTLTDPLGKVAGTGYSGNNEGYNNPDMADVPNVGPTPPGTYDIGPPFTHPLAGPVTMRLSPHPGTEEFGRAGFMIHGDTAAHAADPRPDNSASEGCIVLPRQIRQTVATSAVRVLLVTP
jgi:hypothetical protein